MISVRLQPKQGELYDLICATGPEVATIIGGGGAKGGGKSRGTRSIALQLAADLGEKYPGIVITIVRRVYRDLKDNHIDPILRENPELYRYWRAGDEQIRFGSQATVSYRYAQNEEDVKRKFLGGYESAIIIVDEAQQFSQQELEWISTAARWTGSRGIPDGLCKTVLLFNPGGVSAAYMRRVFWLKRYEGRERAHSYAFVHIFGWDNYEWFRGQVDVGEREFYRLSSMCSLGTEELGVGRCCRFHLFIRETSEGRKYNAYPPSIRMGYLLGNFEHFEGQYFAGVWSEERSCINKDEQNRLLQHWWVRWLSNDPGFRHHTATYWWAAGRVGVSDLKSILGIVSGSPVDVVLVYRELVVSGVAEPDLAREIVARTPRAERPYLHQFIVGADAFSQKRGVEHTIAEMMDQVLGPAGLPTLQRADSKTGSRAMYARLLYNGLRRSSSLRSPNPPAHTEDMPMLLIGPDCPVLQRTLPTLVADENNLEDVLKLETLEDDVFDACVASGTLIETRYGGVYVEHLRRGDFVLTRYGFCEVLGVRLTRKNAPVVRAYFSNGFWLKCTADHMVWNATRGEFSRLDSFKYGDRIESWSSSILKAGSTQKWQAGTSDAGRDSCTGKSGSSTSEKFPQSTTFTTLTITARTTGLRTSPVSAPKSTRLSTGLRYVLNIWQGFRNWLNRGTPQRLEGNGIQTTPKGVKERVYSAHVRSADLPSQDSTTLETASAPQYVVTAGVTGLDGTISERYASSVPLSSSPTSTITTASVPDPAQIDSGISMVSVVPAGLSDVFDIEVDLVPEFYADGVLVHNCKMGFGYYKDALTKAPKDVRRMEVYDSWPKEHTRESMTAMAMALRRFEEGEKHGHRKRRRFR